MSQFVSWPLNIVKKLLPSSIGQKTMSDSLSVTMASDQGPIAASQSGSWNINNVTGTVSLPTGAATETTLSSVNTKLPSSVGQKTTADSLSVTMASNQPDINVLVTGGRAHVDAGNSSTVTLNSGATFTGAWADILNHSNVSIMVKASHASATNGLVFQQSSDGVNIDDTDAFTIPAATGKQFTFGVAARYVRVVYTNGGTNQTYFRLQTLHHPFAPKPSSHRITDIISSDDDAELIKAVLTGQKPNGDFTNFQATAGGNFKVSLEEMDAAISSSGVAIPTYDYPYWPTNKTRVMKLGLNPSISTTREDITEHGSVYAFPTAGIQMRVLSASANDTAAGTGVRQVKITYLDTSWNEQTETITMNGVTPVNTVATNIFRVNDIRAVTVGTGLVAAGNIQLQNTAGTVIYAKITANGNVCRQAIYTVPLGKTLYIDNWTCGAGGLGTTNAVEISLRSTSNNLDAYTADIFQFKDIVSIGNGSYVRKMRIPIKIPAKTDVKISCNSAGVATAQVSGTWDGWIE